MQPFYYEAFTYNASVYCTEHLPVDKDMEEPDHTGTAPHPIFADSEWDYVPTCDVCGMEFDYVTVLEYNNIHGRMLPKLKPGEWRF